MKWTTRLVLVALSMVLFTATYMGIQHINPLGMVAKVLTLPGEEFIPFLPQFFPVYLSAYILFPLVFLSAPTGKDVWIMIRVFSVACIVHYLIFILLPVRYELRPLLVEGTDLMDNMMINFYGLDAPLNCFPSMHVSFVFLCYYFSRQNLPKQARAVGMMAAAIAFSTLVVKQHYLLDVLGGIIVAWILNRFMIEPAYSRDLAYQTHQEN